MQGNNAYYYAVEDDLDEDLFYTQKYKRLYNVIQSMVKDGKTPDLPTVYEYMEAHRRDGDPEPDAGDLADIAGAATTTVNLREYVSVLQNLKRRRDLWKLSSKLQMAGTNLATDLEEVEVYLQKAVEASPQVQASKGITTIAQSLDDLAKQVRQNRINGGAVGFKTGFRILDAVGGLHPSDLDIIAGESGQGKSALTTTIAMNVAAAGTPVIYYSMEMPASQLSARMTAARSGISSSDILYMSLSEQQEQSFLWSAKSMKSLPIYFDDRSTSSIDKIISSIRVSVRQKNVRVAVIDYLQILGRNQRANSEEQFYGDVTRRLKNLAKELDICVIALSQLSRDRNNNPEPSISRLRASGQIEEAADNVILIYRPCVKGLRYTGEHASADTHDTAEIKIAKGRNIGLSSEIIGFRPELTYFYELGDNVPTYINGERTLYDDDRPF